MKIDVPIKNSFISGKMRLNKESIYEAFWLANENWVFGSAKIWLPMPLLLLEFFILLNVWPQLSQMRNNFEVCIRGEKILKCELKNVWIGGWQSGT